MFNDPFFVRNLVYGLEDSFISTTGLLVGITFAGVPLPYIVTSGVILILVEALSMAFGSMVSEESFLIAAKNSYTTTRLFLYASTMFVSYVAAGVLVLLPYILAVKNHYVYSIIIAIIGIFILILIFHKSLIKALLMSFVGAMILALTIWVGHVLQKKQPY